ncbi:MAG: hypothetical protein PHU49_15105 [Syntrophorhabdaceae bacterium]|nr:hypothetical protein [Syntrophorhabdaceae bacterium]
MTDQEALAIYRTHKLCDCEACKLARTILKAMDERCGFFMGEDGSSHDPMDDFMNRPHYPDDYFNDWGKRRF